MPVRASNSVKGPAILDVLDMLPLAVGVGDAAGDFMALAGAFADVAGKRHAKTDPERMARWRMYGCRGEALPLREYPSFHAMQGKTVPAHLATLRTLDDEEQHFRIGASPARLPGGRSGYAFVLQDASAELQALERLQTMLAEKVSDLLDAALPRARMAAARAEPARPAQQAHGSSAVLGPREQDVLRLSALGHSRKEIAGRLGISVKTVDSYQAGAVRKAGLRDRKDVVQYAIAKGWMVAQDATGLSPLKRACLLSR